MITFNRLCNLSLLTGLATFRNILAARWNASRIALLLPLLARLFAPFVRGQATALDRFPFDPFELRYPKPEPSYP
jgi:hypothetical protein